MAYLGIIFVVVLVLIAAKIYISYHSAGIAVDSWNLSPAQLKVLNEIRSQIHIHQGRLPSLQHLSMYVDRIKELSEEELLSVCSHGKNPIQVLHEKT